jgi:hypothetical protein
MPAVLTVTRPRVMWALMKTDNLTSVHLDPGDVDLGRATGLGRSDYRIGVRYGNDHLRT